MKIDSIDEAVVSAVITLYDLGLIDRRYNRRDDIFHILTGHLDKDVEEVNYWLDYFEVKRNDRSDRGDATDRQGQISGRYE